MKGLYSMFGMVAASVLVGTTGLQAEGFKAGRECRGAGFSTCSGVQLSEAGGRVILGEKNARGEGWATPGQPLTLTFVPRVDEIRPGKGHGDTGSVTGCPVPSGNPSDCPLVTVTPEPVSMTLLATGLVGMALARRKRRSEVA